MFVANSLRFARTIAATHLKRVARITMSMLTSFFAILLIFLIAAVPLVYAIRRLFRKPFTPLQWILYFINFLLVRVLWRAELPEHLPIPAGQGAVIICNHRSSIDPCVIQVMAGDRLVHWMVAELYSEHTFIAHLLKQFEIIPVGRRGSDVSPMKTAIRRAADGQLVGMLPEGSVNTTEQFMRPVRPGAVLVALKARVQILPCYIEGAPFDAVPWKPVLMTARVRLKVGKLIDISDYFGRAREAGVIDQLTLECVREIAKLAGQEGFEPQLAGRNWATWK